MTAVLENSIIVAETSVPNLDPHCERHPRSTIRIVHHRSAQSRTILENRVLEEVKVALAINESSAGVCFPDQKGKIDFYRICRKRSRFSRMVWRSLRILLVKVQEDLGVFRACNQVDLICCTQDSSSAKTDGTRFSSVSNCVWY